MAKEPGLGEIKESVISIVYLIALIAPLDLCWVLAGILCCLIILGSSGRIERHSVTGIVLSLSVQHMLCI